MPLNLVLPVQGRGRNLPRLYSATPLSDWELSMTKKGTAFPKKENVHKKQLYCNMYITCELHKMQLALNIKHTVCLDCVCVCLFAVCLFVCLLLNWLAFTVKQDFGFSYSLHPCTWNIVSRNRFFQAVWRRYACECWDLFECVTTQEAEGCLSLCGLHFFSYRCIFWHGCVLAFSKPRNVPIMCSRSWAALITDVFSQLQWWNKEPESKWSAADPAVSVWYVFLFSNSFFFPSPGTKKLELLKGLLMLLGQLQPCT